MEIDVENLSPKYQWMANSVKMFRYSLFSNGSLEFGTNINKLLTI